MRSKAISKVADLRAKANLTQEELALFVGVSTNTIQHWEKENGLNQIDKYIRLCQILGCQNLEDLIIYVEVNEDETTNTSKRFSIEKMRLIRELLGTAEPHGKAKPKKMEGTGSTSGTQKPVNK
jgi:DNA-binding XRE family transcriptional regulator